MTAPAIFATEGLAPTSWSSGPGASYAPHSHASDKVLVCTAGRITFHLSTGDITLDPGDRLDLPAGTEHAATVGSDGVTCWEAFRD